jgi:hypothetical protein
MGIRQRHVDHPIRRARDGQAVAGFRLTGDKAKQKNNSNTTTMTTFTHIDVNRLMATVARLDPDDKEATLNLLGHRRLNAHRSMWPSAQAVDRGMRSLEERIPKAANANETHMKTVLPANEHTSRYMVQEKLNGVHVLWDGKQLWTKTGHPVDVPPQFHRFLPPSFALVGELFFGYGHREFSFATTVARNQLPSKETMEVGASLAARHHVWQHARIVAFDTPMAHDQPYADRYRLLQQLVASWSRYLYQNDNVPFSLLPLQMIAQFPPSALASVFREVVHGVAWRTRQYIPFGIPVHRDEPKEFKFGGHRIMLHTAVGNALYHQHDKHREIMFGPHTDNECSGEGLMLWDQEVIWQGRGSAGRTTTAILKYKPRAVTVGTVTSAEPEHTHRRRGAAHQPETEESGRLPGYTVSVDWWDNQQGWWRTLRPYVSANHGAAQCAARFPQDENVFFTFVMYDQQPMFLHALGNTLPRWDALNVKGMLETRRAQDDAAPAEKRLALLALDDLVHASRWQRGDVCILFPVSFHWSPVKWLRYSGHSRRIAVNPALAPDATWSAKNRDTVLEQSQAATKIHQHRQRDRATQLADRLEDVFDTWLQRAHPVTELFVTFLLLTAAWVARSGTTREWLGVSTTGGMPSQWGPFRAVDAGAGASYGERFIAAQLRLLVTVIASLWLQFGGLFAFTGRISPDVLDTPRGVAFLKSLVGIVDTHLHDVLIPRWEDPHIRDMLWPPGVKQSVFMVNTGPYTQYFSLEVVARYALFAVHGSWSTVPTNLLRIPFGVEPASTIVPPYTLIASDAYGAITELSEGMKIQVDSVISNYMGLGWTLRPDDVPLMARTLLPERQRTDTDSITGVPPRMRGYDAELELARLATKRQLRLMAHRTLI